MLSCEVATSEARLEVVHIVGLTSCNPHHSPRSPAFSSYPGLLDLLGCRNTALLITVFLSPGRLVLTVLQLS